MTVLEMRHFGDEGGGHGAEQRAVVELKRDLGTDRKTGLDDEVVAAGTDNFDLGRWLKAVRIGVLVSDRKDRLWDVATIDDGGLFSKRGLCDLATWLRRLDL